MPTAVAATAVTPACLPKPVRPECGSSILHRPYGPQKSSIVVGTAINFIIEHANNNIIPPIE